MVATSYCSLAGRGATGGVKDHSIVVESHSIDLVRCHKTIENSKRFPVPIVSIIPNVATSYCSLTGREATGGVKDHSKYHSIDLARCPIVQISQDENIPRYEQKSASPRGIRGTRGTKRGIQRGTMRYIKNFEGFLYVFNDPFRKYPKLWKRYPS